MSPAGQDPSRATTSCRLRRGRSAPATRKSPAPEERRQTPASHSPVPSSSRLTSPRCVVHDLAMGTTIARLQVSRYETISRRTLLRGAALGTLALATGMDDVFGQPLQTSSKPNIVFIMADDLGYADVACYGRPDLKTPNIDRIAADGVRFLQAYANSAVCSATRTALITGRYQYRLRTGLEEPLAGNANVGLPPEHPTLPSLLKKVGYSSTLIGKWHLGVPPKFGPLKSGYDHFYGFRGAAVDYYAHSDATQKDDLWDEDVSIHQVGYLTDLLGSRAVDVVNGYAKSGQPFLLSLHFNAPHWPWEA